MPSTKKKDIKDSLDYPLSNLDLSDAIRTLNDRANIKSDDQIHPHTHIEDIFNNKGHCILFHKWPGQNVGHWYTLLRYPDKRVLIFDSLNNNINKLCKNLVPFLENNGIKIIQKNKKKYQNTGKGANDTAVCGRYGLTLYLLHKLQFSNEQIFNFLENLKKRYGSYDLGVLNFTS